MVSDKYFTISIDDGNPTDQKTAELLNKYDLKAIFYIPDNPPPKEGREGIRHQTHCKIV